MKKFALLFSLLLSFTLAFSQTLYLDPGKTIPTDDPKGIPVLSYSFDNNLHSVNLQVEMGTYSSALFDAVASGTFFKKMELDSYNAKDKVDYSYVFSGVILTSLQTSGTTQTVTLSFLKLSTK